MGRSGRWRTSLSIADLADDAHALLDTIGWADAHVLGVSLGGMVAQELALRHPEQIRTLTLGCTYAGGEGSLMTSPDVLQALGEAALSGDRDRAIRQNFETNVSTSFAWPWAARALTRTPKDCAVPPTPTPVRSRQDRR